MHINKKIIYFLVISLCIFSCSTTDDQNLDVTFLEKYEGTVWLKNNPEQVLYIRFINNPNTPLEYWIKDDTCFNYYLEKFFKDKSLTVNSENTLEFSYYRCIDATECVNIITLEVIENSIQLESKHFEDGILVATENLDYTKSNKDVDNFILCNN